MKCKESRVPRKKDKTIHKIIKKGKRTQQAQSQLHWSEEEASPVQAVKFQVLFETCRFNESVQEIGRWVLFFEWVQLR